MLSTALTASGLARLQCREVLVGGGSLSWVWALGNCRVNCQNQFVLTPHNSEPAETCFYGRQTSNWPQEMEVISKEVFIVTNLGCIPSQHLFLKQVEFKEPWRRKAEKETHQSHLTVLETALLARPWQGSCWESFKIWHSSSLSGPHQSSLGAHVSIIPPALMEHLLYTWHGAGRWDYRDEGNTVTPVDSPRAGGGGGEGDRAAIQSEGDSLIHLFAQEIFSK